MKETKYMNEWRWGKKEELRKKDKKEYKGD